MDVTNKETILRIKAYIEEKEGRLHVLVNKFVRSTYSLVIDVILHPARDSLVPLLPFSTIKKRRKIKPLSPLEQLFSIANHLKIGAVTFPSICRRYFS